MARPTRRLPFLRRAGTVLAVAAAAGALIHSPPTVDPRSPASAGSGDPAGAGPLDAGARSGSGTRPRAGTAGRPGAATGRSPEAPPGFRPAATHGEPERPTPPDGYAYTALSVAAAAPMPAGEDTADALPQLAWLHGSLGIEGLARKAVEAGRGWTFGWVGVGSVSARSGVRAAIRAEGGEVLGEAGPALRARLPGDRSRLAAIRAAPGVTGIAATPRDLKLPRRLAETAASNTVRVFVTLMADDPDGRWRDALAALGAVTGHYDPAIRAVAAEVPAAALEALARADFVLAVEPAGRVRAALDTAVPAMGADALRTLDAASDAFVGAGGASVPVGLLDSGLNVAHPDLGRGRASVCGANFATLFDAREEDRDLWFDAGSHGSHVAGILLGSGAVERRYAGMAPSVRDVRVAKVLGISGTGTLEGVLRGMDFLAGPTACAGGAPATPLLVNASLSRDEVEVSGRGTAERKLDAVVWRHRQLYVVANSNAGDAALGDLAAAKNSLAVGAVHDGGDVAGFSSHGPTADGRLAPQVVGTGVAVRAAAGAGSRTDYWPADGTSQAAPSVAGVAALLMDAAPGYRGQPAAVRARMMASAVRPDAFLDSHNLFPSRNDDGPGGLQHRYGLGKVSARTTVLSRDAGDGWVTGGASVDLDASSYAWHDVAVPPGASRLDVVLTWDEPPADTLVQPVTNDLDLWVDRDADCALAACGEDASRSRRDNVEWVVLRRPAPGVYRLKAVPRRRLSGVRAALAWTVIRGPSTPRLEVRAAAGEVSAPAGGQFEVELEVATDGYVAAGTTLRIDCRGSAAEGDGDLSACAEVALVAPASRADRGDAVERTLDRESDRAIALGEIAAGERRRVALAFRAPDQPGRFRLFFTATAWNARGGTAGVAVNAGGSDAPPPPGAGTPANDDHAAAERLAGDAGTRSADLLLATAEPGEPGAGDGMPGVRPRSLWYAWTAPATDTFRFSVDAGDRPGIADDLELALFAATAGEPLAELAPAGAAVGGGIAFAAERGRDHRVRLGRADWLGQGPDVRPAVAPVTVRWSRAPVPANDAWGGAERIAGAEGAADGSNLAATEAGGRFGPLAATTWFRWTAPADGDWRFEVNRRRLVVAAFAGETADDARLVSGLPAAQAVFPTRGGDAYRIAVAAPDAHAAGSDYTLRWGRGQRAAPANDDLAQAAAMPNDGDGHTIPLDTAALTVEPGEPAETGVRTAWWRWTPPSDGTWTWLGRRLEAPLRLSVFRRDREDALIPVAGTDAAHLQLSWQASAEETYLVSVGLPQGAAFAETSGAGGFGEDLLIEWGRAPDNDHAAAAAALAGASGTTSGNSRFGTTEPGEDTAGLGDASLWWEWEAPDDDWFGFSVESPHATALAVYRRDGLGGLVRVAASRRLGDAEGAVFRAEAGARYLIRLGTVDVEGGEFTLSWARHGPPAWLRYGGILGDGDIDAAGRAVSLAEVGAMAVHPDGGTLFAATFDGLQVFRRDAATGRLTLLQTLRDVQGEALLLWDAASDSLVAGSCDGWMRFPRSAQGGGLDAPVAMSGDSPCPGRSAFADASGTLVGIVRPSVGLETFRLDAGRTAVEAVGTVDLPGISAAALSAGGGFVYVAAADQLHVLARDADTDALVPHAVVEGGEKVAGEQVEGLHRVAALAVDDAGTTLFAFGAGGAGVAAFDLADPGSPRFLDALEPFVAGALFDVFNFGGVPPADPSPTCPHASVRPGRLAVDAVCRSSAFSAQLVDGTLRPEDELGILAADRYGRYVPDFHVTGGVAASPDGRHLYAGLARGVLILERTAAP